MGAEQHLLVFAAASLKPAFDEMRRHPDMAMADVVVSHGASSQLARQIEHGAPASVFVSADRAWMDHLERGGLIERGSRLDLLGNTLVLVAPAAAPIQTQGHTIRDLLAALGSDERLAIAEPGSVPAGRYAKAALTTLGLWTSVEARTVHAADVRAALAFVSRGEVALGIVYASEAISEPTVRVVATFPPDTHAPIVYPAAIVNGQASPRARSLLLQLCSPVAREVFARHGFTPLAPAFDQP